MPDERLFYKFYDTLFASKDYNGEVDAIMSHCRLLGLQPLRRILELGCGTGNHTLALSQDQCLQITAVDIDPEMLALAQKKVKQAGRTNVTFAGDCRAAHAADLAVALFNVVNYLMVEDSLGHFFGEVAATLRPGGIFVFDCWNGAAALVDPPGSKTYEEQCGNRTVRCHLTSETDTMKKITTLNYHLESRERSGKLIEADDHAFDHRLWTPNELKKALGEAGFVVDTVCMPFQFRLAAAPMDWKIMFVSRKV